ncbi:hypothetical protein GGF37_002793 [Kickxella alabastrina]|nr:hypothetical protein GGF37_002793 [Kickxella alabastrina]
MALKWVPRSSRMSLSAVLGAIATLTLALSGVVTASSEQVKMTTFPSVLYVASPYAMCFGVLIKEQTILTDARCLYPFSNSSSVPREVSGLLKPDYLMVALPTVNTSATMHNVLLSTQVYPNPDQAGFRASTFFGLVANYVDNTTFFAVESANVHSYYPQSQYIEEAEQNFDVGIITLKHPMGGVPLASLFIDDMKANTAGLTALSFSSPNLSSDPATQQVLYRGIDLTVVRTTDVSSLSRSECNKNYIAAYGLKDLKSFNGHPLPGNNPPAFCSSIYENTTLCDLDASIAINSKNKDEVNSYNLNSTILFVPDGSSIRIVSVGQPHLFEVRSDPLAPCSSNGFVHYPRTGMYTDWIGWATKGSIATNGSWVDKVLSGNVIADFVDGRDGSSESDSSSRSSAASKLSAIGAILAASISVLAVGFLSV